MAEHKAVETSVEEAVDNAAGHADPELARLTAQRRRSIWLALALFGFVILVGVTSALQLRENIQLSSGEAASEEAQ